MKHKKIVLVAPKLSTKGGPGLFADNWTRFAEDYEIILYNTARKPNRNDNFLKRSFQRKFYSYYETFKKILKYNNFIKKNKASGIHIKIGCPAAIFWEGVVYFFLSKIYTTKIILHSYSHLDSYYYTTNRLNKKVFEMIFKYSQNNIVLAKSHVKLLESFNEDVYVDYIPTHIDLVTHTKFSSVRGKFNKGKFLFVAGIYPTRKGIIDIFIALNLISKNKDRDIFVDIIGGFNSDIFKSLVSNLGIDRKVKFHGFVENKKRDELYRSCCALLLPSYLEGFPHVILEAMYQGVPIIATNIAGIPDAIVDNENGLLMEPGDYSKLAHNMIKLSNNDLLRDKLISKSKLKVKNYSLDKVGKQLLTIYNRVY